LASISQNIKNTNSDDFMSVEQRAIIKDLRFKDYLMKSILTELHQLYVHDTYKRFPFEYWIGEFANERMVLGNTL
jgi:hypothetical protein